MNFIALKMLLGDRAEYVGIVIGLTLASFLVTWPSAIFIGVMSRTFSFVTDIDLRVRVPLAFAEKVYDIVSPGSTVVVTGAPALRASPSAHAVLLMEAGKNK